MSGTDGPEPDFKDLIDYIQEQRGIDFHGYKRTSLRRRIIRRMEQINVEDFATYHALLEANPEEFAELLNTVLINVTAFFRDPETWAVLQREVVPRIVEWHRTSGTGIRVWSAGCASGQEPYSLAMLFAEALGGPEAFCRAAKIYATDLDEPSLQLARQATYTEAEMDSVPPDLRQRYFEASNGRSTLIRDLRRCVIFGRHNIVHDAPIGHVNLIVCRNLLIYLEASTQEEVLARLHYALVDGGYLCLGKAETQLARSRLFEPLDLRHRIFRKTGSPERHRSIGGSISLLRGAGIERVAVPPARLQSAIVDGSAIAYLAVDMEGQLAFANPAARRLLELGEADIGRPFQDLSISYRPTELRSRIEEAQQKGRMVRLENLEFHRAGADPLRLTIEVTPLFGQDGQQFVTLLGFTDTTHAFMLAQELQGVQEGLETHIEELQSANEELETTNEELQSTREELETTNEELQSTNEELETTNEELRSTNEELEVANAELRRQSEEAADFRRYTDAILRSMGAGIVVLDRDLRVRSWNRWSENTWGLRAEEVIGHDFLPLDIGLPVQRLHQDLHRVLLSEEPQTLRELRATDRRGRPIHVRVRILPLLREERAPEGVVLVMEDVTEAMRNEDYIRHLGRIIGQSLNEVYFLDPKTLRFTLVNHGAEEKLGYSLMQLRQTAITDLMPGIAPERMHHLIAPLLSGERRDVVFEAVLRSSGGRDYPVEVCLQHFRDEQPPFVLAIVHDISERQRLAGVG
ncbi:PAS domain S-box protein [Rhodovastum atsumiense]|uniref:protein-glutamate O-methyltransferase n=2 Tax=Rhodovastum atsumiense TaxID=504468 RepID=A0A5M6IU91_9PROT|nr:PAS domain S-box protein [Rhodovastum atsumiense]